MVGWVEWWFWRGKGFQMVVGGGGKGRGVVVAGRRSSMEVTV
jgi:hypothetical protein